MTVAEVAAVRETIAPLTYAESWDRVGLLLGWALLVATMRDLPRLDNRVLPLADVAGDRSDWLARLLGINGVLEAVVVEEEGIALLKVDPEQLDEVALKQWSADGAGTLQT